MFLSSNLLLVLTCKSHGVHLQDFLPFLEYFEKKWYWLFTCVVALSGRAVWPRAFPREPLSHCLSLAVHLRSPEAPFCGEAFSG